jgi:hypothetical protein
MQRAIRKSAFVFLPVRSSAKSQGAAFASYVSVSHAIVRTSSKVPGGDDLPIFETVHRQFATVGLAADLIEAWVAQRRAGSEGAGRFVCAAK